ncbi:MAG: endo-1,4-beta-xylanase [Taibaiella sp.]|nr:endo-1,4-beta-xylanase [Taibaiella sp.]
MKNTIIICCLLLLAGCGKPTATQVYTTCDMTSIYSHTSFPVGVAVDAYKLQTNDQYRNIVIAQFNSLTGENAFKFESVEPAEGQYNWTETDYIADFARQYGKRLHGHTLVWHSQLPDWVPGYTGDWRSMLRDHITQEVGRYKDVIHSWDVVNEAFNEDGTLRSTLWLTHLGTGYIQMAFEDAHAANPQAKLFYNDYNLEWNPQKLDGVLRLLTQLRAAGVQVDGIGMQMHISSSYPDISLAGDAAKKIANTGFLVHFSELDVNMKEPDSRTLLSADEQQQQARRYAAVFTAYSQLSPAQQFGITLWGVSDADSWIVRGLPLLFDNNYTSKPAYCACKSLK